MVVDISIIAMENRIRVEHSKRRKRGSLVGASVLDVAGLLAAVANALRSGLGGAVAGQVADLTACGMLALY